MYLPLFIYFLRITSATPIVQPKLGSIVAFGDELSDTGSGSFAHGMTSNPASVYGFNTWTNGPVAVSCLATKLNLTLTSYAFGGCCGGAKFGATLDNKYTPSEAGAPSLQDQIANYSNMKIPEPSSSLGFIWAGQNDLNKHTDAYWEDDPMNEAFAQNYTEYNIVAAKKLLALGVAKVVVVGMYLKQIAPVTDAYLCDDDKCVQTWGRIVQRANSKLRSAVEDLGPNALYYDAFGTVQGLAQNPIAYGFTRPLTEFCDGQGDQSWDACMTTGVVDGQTKIVGWDEFFWMTFVQPTARVHALVGANMSSVLNKVWSLASAQSNDHDG